MEGSDNALFTLHGDGLPADRQVFSYHAMEQVSALYSVQVEFATEDDSFNPAELLRKRILLQVTDNYGRSRFFDGIVSGGAFLSLVGAKLHFRLELAPPLALLQYREDCRIFQDQSVPDIVRALLDEADLSKKVRWELSQSYSPREYTVQFRESTFNFISRLLEDEGIFYFFSHSEAGHELIFADAASAFEDHEGHFPGVEKVQYALSQGLLSLGEPLTSFRRGRALRATSALLRDFEFKAPQVKPEAHEKAQDGYPLPYYEYGADFSKKEDGTRKALARLRSLRADSDTCAGASSAIDLRAGGLLTVDGGAEDLTTGSFVALRVETWGLQEGTGADSQNYAARNRFWGIPVGVPFAPARRAHRPRICGLQTAVVTGPEADDQSIHVDLYGRIKVHFFWDRLGQYDDKSSCWMRVNQVPMGGSMILPRLGWEVSVLFLDGNPDRPVVVGRAYNAENMPPMSLPAGKASGSLKSMSSPGAAGSNELSMGDSGGSQGFGMKAQKDLNIRTNYDCVTDIQVDDEHLINKNLSRTVKVDDAVQIGANQKITIGANYSANIGASQAVTVGANDTSNATANFVEKIGGDRSYTVGANRTTINNGVEMDVTKDHTRQVGAVDLVVSGQGISDNILGNSTASAGAARIHLVKGSHGETVGGARTQTIAAAELHIVGGTYGVQCDGMASTMVGAVCMQKVKGDIKVSAPMISLLGAVGQFKGGSSEFKLSGGPIMLKGSKISIKGALIKKMGVSLKQA